MAETDRLIVPSEGFELEFVEREATPEPLMKLSIHLHAAGLSLSDTVTVLYRSGVGRCRSTVHNRMRKADLRPADGKSPNRLALDEAMIQLNNERYWLLVAVDPATTNPCTSGSIRPA